MTGNRHVRFWSRAGPATGRLRQQQRISAYRLTGKSVTFAQQCRDLTELRAGDPVYAAINAQSEQVTRKRLDLAFAAFFRRVKARQAPGFPRFKSFERFSGFGSSSRSGR